MAIWTPSTGATPSFGVEGGECWARAAGSNTLSAAPRLANRLARRQFTSWTDRARWTAIWDAGTDAQREQWEEATAGRWLWAFTGRPGPRSGREWFVTYWANREAMGYAEPADPWEVPAEPTWSGIIQPFEEWLDKDTGCAWVARGAREGDLEFFVAYQPATPGRGKLTRSRLERVGRFVLPAGDAGQRWEAPAEAAAAILGEGVRDGSLQVWAMAWEVSAGQPQTVLDPCNTPPVQPPPPAGWPEHLTYKGKPDGGGVDTIMVTKTQDTPYLVTYGGNAGGVIGGGFYALQAGGWYAQTYTSGPNGNAGATRIFAGQEIPNVTGFYVPLPGTTSFEVTN